MVQNILRVWKFLSGARALSKSRHSCPQIQTIRLFGPLTKLLGNRVFQCILGTNWIITQKVGRWRYVFSLEIGKGVIGASVARYRGSYFNRFSMCRVGANIKSFLPPLCFLESKNGLNICIPWIFRMFLMSLQYIYYEVLFECIIFFK